MFAVSSVVAARPVVGFHSTAEAVERAPEDPRLPEDRVSLSDEARRGLQARRAGAERPDGKRLDAQQEKEVADLKQRDLHVRQHEAAHQAAGGDLAGSASFTYQVGPDGRSYAVGGEVPIAARSGRTPDETIAIARRVRAAALAPADPSAADLAAAAQATAMEQQAVQQRQAQRERESAARGPDGTFDRVYFRTPVDRVA